MSGQTRTAAVTDAANHNYRTEIDGLRGFAVIAVILNHFNRDLLPSGYLGVDIFFVISGYVITASLAARQEASLGRFLAGFYQRRVKRLLPALALFVLVMSVLISLLNPSPQASVRTGIASLFGASNIVLLADSADYFSQSSELNPFTQTWSLGVEEQFYLAFPLLIWASGFGRRSMHGAKTLGLWIGGLAIVSLSAFIWLYQDNQAAAYFLMPTRFWEIASGCLVFLALNHTTRISTLLGKLPPLMAASAMAVVIVSPAVTPVPATIIIVVLTAILIACLRPGTVAYRGFTNAVATTVGRISYSLYLWHWGVLSIARWSFGTGGGASMVVLILPFFLATLSYHFVEQPFRRSGVSPARTLASGVIGTSSLALVMAVNLLDPYVLSLIRGKLGSSESAYHSHWHGWKDCHDFPIPGAEMKEGGCKRFSVTGREPSLAIIGDSHAGHLAPAVKGLAMRLHQDAVIFHVAGCFPTDLDDRCRLIQAAIRWLADNKSVKTVILTGYHNLVYQKRLHQYAASEDPEEVDPKLFAQMQTAMERIVSDLGGHGKKIIFVVDSHELDQDPAAKANAMTWSVEGDSLNLPRKDVMARNKDFYQLVQALAVRHPHFHPFFLSSLFCDQNVCHASDNNGRLFFQSPDHLTPYASRKISASLIRALIRIEQQRSISNP
ncbi:MAG: acyltransferase family protein [Synechococcaceae cyanobacterium]|nr:acyltransferase family protein [Synechococcaceae cyanobacterium]